jgi:hypothetical protein
MNAGRYNHKGLEILWMCIHQFRYDVSALTAEYECGVAHGLQDLIR